MGILLETKRRQQPAIGCGNAGNAIAGRDNFKLAGMVARQFDYAGELRVPYIAGNMDSADVVYAGDARNGIVYRYWVQECEVRLDGWAIYFNQTMQACERFAARNGLIFRDANDEPREYSKCPHFKLIQRFYAIAEAQLLDVKADDAMRAAIGRYFGKELRSRSLLDATQWSILGDACERGELVW